MCFLPACICVLLICMVFTNCLELESQMIVSHHEVLGTEPCPLQEQQMLMTTEPSFQTHFFNLITDLIENLQLASCQRLRIHPTLFPKDEDQPKDNHS